MAMMVVMWWWWRRRWWGSSSSSTSASTTTTPSSSPACWWVWEPTQECHKWQDRSFYVVAALTNAMLYHFTDGGLIIDTSIFGSFTLPFFYRFQILSIKFMFTLIILLVFFIWYNNDDDHHSWWIIEWLHQYKLGSVFIILNYLVH